MNKAIRVLLVDDQALFLEGLRLLLEMRSEDIMVVGEAANGREALAAAQRLMPDVLLMDLNMPELNGVAATVEIKKQLPACQVIVLTTFDDDEMIFDAVRAGALGYLLKDTPGDRLVEAIRAAHRGEAVLQPNVAARLLAEFTRVTTARTPAAQPVDGMSAREIEIIKLLATGATNKEIGTTLFLTEGTVKNYVTTILSKLNVRDRTQAALRARELGLLSGNANNVI
jgi:DNA-binding NarL/FixJ family response regulator